MRKMFDMFVWIITIVLIGIVFLMPPKVPIHWDLNGEIDGYGSRYIFMIVACFPMLIDYGMLLVKEIDPKKKSFQNREKIYHLYRYGLTAFLIIMLILIDCIIFFQNIKIEKFVFLFVGLFMIGMGNYMPRLPQNYFIGIKTPWTLANDNVWQKTHRIGGYSFVIIGFILLICSLLKRLYGFFVLILLISAEIVFVYGYSYYIYQKSDRLY